VEKGQLCSFPSRKDPKQPITNRITIFLHFCISDDDSSDYSAFVARIFHHFTGQQDPWPPVATSTNPFDSPPRDNMPAQPPTEYFGQPERVTGHQAEPNTNFLQKKIPIFNPPNLDSQPK
jgi:hypothetical protein